MSPRLRPLSALLLLLAACTSPPRARDPFAAPPVLEPGARDVTLISGTGDGPVGWDELVDRAAASDVVLIGETHGHPLGLAAAAALFDDLLTRDADGPALALEFFERDDQIALDDYATDVIDEAGLIAALGLTPGRYPPGHRAMVRAAHAHDRPVYAANAPRRYVSLARTRGFDFLRALGPTQRRTFAVPWTTSRGEYRQRFTELMRDGGHGPSLDDERVEAAFRSQNLWDATMADTVVTAARAGAAPLVLVVGRFHTAFEGGLLQRLRAAAPHLSVLSLSVLPESSDGLRPEDQGRADVVVYAGPSDGGD